MVKIIAFLIICGPMLVMMWYDHEKKKVEKENKKNLEAFDKEIDNLIQNSVGGTNQDRFFIECVLADCTDFTKESNVRKAKIIADKYNVSYETASAASKYINYNSSYKYYNSDSSGIKAAFNRAMQEHLRITGKAPEIKLAKKREAEKREFEVQNRYSEYYGKEKKIAMLRDRVDNLRQRAAGIQGGGDAALKSVSYQTEHNWGIAGGIASGIAGPVAGVAAALDAQRQNAEIRKQNQENISTAVAVNMAFTMQAAPLRVEADKIEKEISLVQEKLVSDMSTAEVMEKLEIVSPTVEVSETGAFRVIATVKPKDSLYIYEDVFAVADGTIIAHVKDGNREIGTAKMVFPVNGIGWSTNHIEGIGLSGAEIGKNYTVTFTPYKLWLMEA